jgi:hypothetical protein
LADIASLAKIEAMEKVHIRLMRKRIGIEEIAPTFRYPKGDPVPVKGDMRIIIEAR